uniref:RNA helicase n=2 Tax=Meloidogyne incognita group TaxID=654580 RepID=A0A915LTH7_MELJA
MVKEKRKDQAFSYRTICGGLEIVNPLPGYPQPPVYKRLLGSRLSAKCGDWEAKSIIEELKKDPITIPEFVAKFQHVNQIEWAQVWLDSMENASKESKVKYVRKKQEMHYYRIIVDKKFIEANKLRRKCEISVIPNNGFVDEICERDCIIVVKFFPSKIYPPEHMDPSLTYQVIALPSIFVFNTRCRTLDTLTQFPGNWAKCIFPSYRNELAKKLLPMKNYESFEKEFISSTTFSSNRQFNEKQKIAIHAIVSGLHGNIPYILFGPPGTGKTVTLVESVRLICENDSMARILVCTPSNTAADAFTLCLMSTNAFTSGSILRIFSLSKAVYEQNDALFDKNQSVLCIKDSSEGPQFGIFPKTELIAKKRVIICTLNTSTYLINGGLNDCFTHIIIDEAGQADELEALIPLVGLISFLNDKTKIIFAGDPKQLGPVQTCDPLKKMAKSMALIERLTDFNGLMNSFDFDKRITTMLENNYRSHPTFLTIPSQLFYGGKLCPSAPIKTKNTLCHWNDLPNKNNFPLLWHSIVTPESRDTENKSYQNIAECDVVCGYVQKLTIGAKVKASDIGIITPYRFQIKLLRSRFAKTHPQMLIDSVERFQGCERRVIIISTVRSNGIGFLDCQKRFNTAVTRPMELLIIVGDCRNMAKVDCWRRLITYCQQNNALINFGSLPPIPSNDIRKLPILFKNNVNNIKNNNIVEEIITLKKNKRQNMKNYRGKYFVNNNNNKVSNNRFTMLQDHQQPKHLKKNNMKEEKRKFEEKKGENKFEEEVKKGENRKKKEFEEEEKEEFKEEEEEALNYRCDNNNNGEEEKRKKNEEARTTNNKINPFKKLKNETNNNNDEIKQNNIKIGGNKNMLKNNKGFALGTKENPIIIADDSPPPPLPSKNIFVNKKDIITTKNSSSSSLPAVSNNFLPKLEKLEEEMEKLKMTRKGW